MPRGVLPPAGYFPVSADRPGRMRCCVPHCRHTTKVNSGKEWICRDHWRLASPEARAELFTLRHRWRVAVKRRPQFARYWEWPPGHASRQIAVRFLRRLDESWTRCKSEAIERAAGI
jgi:hypothetical protein